MVQILYELKKNEHIKYILKTHLDSLFPDTESILEIELYDL